MKKFKKIIRAVLVLAVLAGLIYLIPKVITVVRLKRAADSYVAASSVSTFKDSKTTIIYDTNDQELCTMKNTKDMYYVSYQEIPVTLVNSFVVMEDRQFYKHSGYDIKAILRAIVINQKSNDIAQGASTITQQLIKNNIFSGGMETSWGARIERKLQEQYLAVQLEKNSGLNKEETKKTIITNYLNTINLGSNTLGVKVAARRYFNKEVSDLTLAECTVLASITSNPSRYNPITNPENNNTRRQIVLQNMVDQNYISKQDMENALSDDVYDRIQNVNTATKETNSHYSYFTDELIEQVTEALMKKLGYTESQASNLVYSGGLKIYTTQDPKIQAIVDEEVNDPGNYTVAKYSVEYRLSVNHADGTTQHYSEENLRAYRKNTLGDTSFEGLYNSKEEVQADIDRYKEWLLKDGDDVIAERQNLILQPQASFFIMDQHTGEVKALSGGRGEKTASRTLNRATNVYRQPGSSFKVLTAFAPAIDTCGATLGTVYYDAPYTIGTKTFRNWWGESRGFTGYSNIREGIIYSMNIVAVRTLMETVTPQLGVEYAENLGITSLTKDDLGAALSLGGITKGVSNMELTAAYAAIANGGVYTTPRFFTKILDHDGKVLIDNEPETKQVLKDSTAFLLTDAMSESMKANRKFARSGVSINSTSTRAALTGMSAAGKSGTTTSNNDVWFVGFTPYYTAGVWGGCDNNQKLKHGGVDNGGTSFHKDIWRNIMNRVHEGLEDPGFTVPDSVETAEICRKSGKRAVSGVCDHDPRGDAVYTEYFAKGTAPTEVCDKHVAVTVCAESGKRSTEYCPTKTTKVCMVLPEGEEDLATDDSVFSIPGYCNIHGRNSTIISPTIEDNDNSGGETTAPTKATVVPVGPGYQPTTAPEWEYTGPGAKH